MTKFVVASLLPLLLLFSSSTWTFKITELAQLICQKHLQHLPCYSLLFVLIFHAIHRDHISPLASSSSLCRWLRLHWLIATLVHFACHPIRPRQFLPLLSQQLSLLLYTNDHQSSGSCDTIGQTGEFIKPGFISNSTVSTLTHSIAMSAREPAVKK